jgi:hypothetical protein
MAAEAREHAEAVKRETKRRRAEEREMRQAHQVRIRSEDWESWERLADGASRPHLSGTKHKLGVELLELIADCAPTSRDLRQSSEMIAAFCGYRL